MPRNNPWSDEERDYLRANYETKNFGRIAKALNRSRSSVSGQASSMGLKKASKPNLSLVSWAEPKLKTNLIRKAATPKEKRQRYIAEWEARKLAQRGQYSKAAARTYHDRVQP